jgi:hypothetical protein
VKRKADAEQDALSGDRSLEKKAKKQSVKDKAAKKPKIEVVHDMAEEQDEEEEEDGEGEGDYDGSENGIVDMDDDDNKPKKKEKPAKKQENANAPVVLSSGLKYMVRKGAIYCGLCTHFSLALYTFFYSFLALPFTYCSSFSSSPLCLDVNFRFLSLAAFNRCCTRSLIG